MGSCEHHVATTIIGVVGVGRMGAPISRALSEHFIVHAFDIAPHPRREVHVARWAESLEELTASADVLVTVLPGPPELRRTMVDSLPTLRAGSLWVDLTSGDPALTRELAAEARERGVDVVSAPMGGSPSDASRRTLTFFVGGAEDAVARALPILERLSEPGGIRRAGPRTENGQIVKLLANGLWFAHAAAAAEAMLIGQGLGVAPDDLHRLLLDSAGSSRMLEQHFPRVLDGDYLTSFGIDRVVEELATIAAMRTEVGADTPLLDASARLHSEALERFGPVPGELLAVRELEERAGRYLR